MLYTHPEIKKKKIQSIFGIALRYTKKVLELFNCYICIYMYLYS